MSLFLDFVKALTNNEVLINRAVEVRKKADLMSGELRSDLLKDCEVPNFDAGMLLYEGSPECIGPVKVKEIITNTSYQELRFPFEKFAIAFSIVDDDSNEKVDNVLLIKVNSDGDRQIQRSIKFDNRQWSYIPMFVTIAKGAEPNIYYKHVYAEPSEKDCKNLSDHITNALKVILSLLDRPEITSLVFDKALQFRRHNDKSRSTKVQLTKIIRVNQENLVKAKFTSETSERGSPKSGHLRRGHWRRLPNGGKRWIDDVKIKGGPIESPLIASSYKLVNDKDRVVFGEV